MATKIILVVLIFVAGTTYASNLTLDFHTKDLKLKGDFTFKPGAPMKISGSDNLGVPYELKVIAKLQKEDFVQFIYELKRREKGESGSVITRKNEIAKLTTTPEDDKTTAIHFEAKWSE